MKKSFNKELAGTLAKFFGIILFLYLGKEYVISAIHPLGKYYSPFIQSYFNVPEWFRSFLLHSSDYLLQALGYHTERNDPNLLRIHSATGINLTFACIGFNVMIFWVAFVLADNYTSIKQKAAWLFAGIGIILLINIFRLCILTLSSYYRWWNLSAIDHHTLFNVVAYLLVFYLMFLYMRRSQSKLQPYKSVKKQLPQAV